MQNQGHSESIPFEKNRIESEENPDFPETMRAMRGGLINMLDAAEPITEDITAIDNQLRFAAETWSIAALSNGIRYLRTGIPPDKGIEPWRFWKITWIRLKYIPA